MDHAEVIEQIELAAIEPGGLARLAAGDTAESAAIAGHLVGCDACADELARTARASTVARTVIRELPDPALRERTLALVREVGIDRSKGRAAAEARGASPAAEGSPAVDQASPIASSTTPPTPVAVPVVTPPASVVPLARRGPRLGWWAAAVAAVLVAAIGGFGLGGALRPASTPDDGGSALAAMQTTMHIASQPDAVRIQLASTGGSQGSGTLVYSATTGELAMAVTGLAPAPDGATYACWVEQGGQRRRIGVMYMDGADGSWAGPVSGLSALASGATFGVSLVSAGSSTGTPVLLGSS